MARLHIAIQDYPKQSAGFTFLKFDVQFSDAGLVFPAGN
jgi:hypothetical protein